MLQTQKSLRSSLICHELIELKIKELIYFIENVLMILSENQLILYYEKTSNVKL